MAQMGFYFDADNCIGCHTCRVACKDVNRLEIGEDYRHVTSYCTGSGFDVHMYHISIACNHCSVPACVAYCTTGAMYKDDETGLVLHDHEVCIGCETCTTSCPYSHPILIKRLGITGKCDACAGLRFMGEEPSCVASCPQRVIEFGVVEELKARHSGEGLVSDCAALPSSSQTSPNLYMNIKACMIEADFDQLVL